METKEIFVKAHTRTIKQKVYRFVCKECNQVSERICYPCLPLYCSSCRPSKPKSTKPDKVVAALKKKRKPSANKRPKSATA
ncbi:hypothetical protein AMR41_30920 [Hapalosiphon sp. MRB220]|nr:hypothetical protein AMR41_30920 [Hapalosiphon sp. MRB220]